MGHISPNADMARVDEQALSSGDKMLEVRMITDHDQTLLRKEVALGIAYLRQHLQCTFSSPQAKPFG